MADKYKRNGPCWCKSGKKYKKCHGHPSYKSKPALSEFMKDQSKIYTQDKCYAPDDLQHECSEKIIKAHTVSRSANLKPISKSDHVYCFEANLGGMIKTNGQLTITKKSIKKTSIFHGFCSKHDTELFKKVDLGFEISNEHIFLNHYRTLTRELYLKEKNSIFQSGKMKEYDKGMSLIDQIIYQSQISGISMGTDVGERDLKKVKSILDEKLISNNYDGIKYYALIIDSVPEIMSTGVWVVSSDFENNQLADLSILENSYNSMSVSTLLYSNNKGILLFSWEDSIDCPECTQFIQTLNKLSNDEKVKAIVYWLFSVNENIYFSPDWWEALDPSKQEQISQVFHSTLLDLPDLSLFRNLDVIKWNIDEISTNIEL